MSLKEYPDRYPTNTESIGIEVVADFDEDTKTWQEATPEQLESLGILIDMLQRIYGLTLKDIYRHDDISYKEPGEGAGLGY